MKKKYKYGLNVMNSAKKFQKGSVKIKKKTVLIPIKPKTKFPKLVSSTLNCN